MPEAQGREERKPSTPEVPPTIPRLLIASLLVALISYLAVAYDAVGLPLLYLPQALLLLVTVYLIGVGADWLVDSASGIARRLGVSELVIGLTIVAFGTSAPEMAASLAAGFKGNGNITIANIIGSNIFNLCFVLGGVALLVKGGIQGQRALVVRDGPVLLFGTVLLFLFVGGIPSNVAGPNPGYGPEWLRLLNLRLEFAEGVILLSILSAYMLSFYVAGRKKRALLEQPAEQRESDTAARPPRPLPDAVMFVAGLLFLVGGCHVLVGSAEIVDGAVRGFGALWLAKMWNIPDYVVGVTIVAAGTSAPEFIVSLVAARRGAFGISTGNLLGSDIFNVLGVVGLSGIILQPPVASPVVVSPLAIPSLAALCGVVVVAIIFLFTGGRISRAEGATLVLLGVVRWVFDFMSR